MESFRDSVLNESAPRRFGTIGEIIVENIKSREKTPLCEAETIHYDRMSRDEGKIEIKFSRAKYPTKRITRENLKSILVSPKFVEYNNKYIIPWDCNIQQVKPREFNVLYYGVMFVDKIVIFRIDNSTIECDKNISYCNKQHKGNTGEGQFHIKSSNYQYHYDNYLYKEFSWQELYDNYLE
jgi:hypothetical protein